MRQNQGYRDAWGQRVRGIEMVTRRVREAVWYTQRPIEKYREAESRERSQIDRDAYIV